MSAARSTACSSPRWTKKKNTSTAARTAAHSRSRRPRPQTLAKQANVAKIEGLRTAADSGEIIGVAAMAKPATGGNVNFGFSTVVTAASGEIEHSVAIFDTSKFVEALDSDALTIKQAAETVTEVFEATADTHISSGQPSTNFGAWPFMYVGGDDVLRGLVQFNVSSVDASYPVDKATLWVYAGGFGGGGSDANLAAHEVVKGWDENSVTWKAPWDPALAGGDVVTSPAGTAPITKADVGKWVLIDVTAVAQKWVADGGSNHGLMLRLVDSTSFTQYRFPTTENTWMVGDAPKLEVTYRKP